MESFKDYFEQSIRASPGKGNIGVESVWLDAGKLHMPLGKLCAVDLSAKEPESGCTLNVPKGVYKASIKGMDFSGHRRVARMRVYPIDAVEIEASTNCGKVLIDGGMIVFYDVAVFEHVSPDQKKQFRKDLQAASMAAYFEAGGIRCMNFNFTENQSLDVAFAPTGLGDGSYNAFSLMSKSRVAGMEIEFLPAGFKSKF